MPDDDLDLRPGGEGRHHERADAAVIRFIATRRDGMSEKRKGSQGKRAKNSLDVDSLVNDLKGIGIPFKDAAGPKDAKPANIIISGIYSPKLDRYPITRLDRNANGGDYISMPVVEDFSYFDDTNRRMAGEIEKRGTDALAWYCPFHRFARNSWGIYIPDASVSYLALKVFNDPQTRLPKRVVRDPLSYALAFRLLFLHEFFHYVTEISASAMEFIKDAACYEDYFAHEYCMPVDCDEPLEEALANAFAFRGTMREIAFRARMERFDRHSGTRSAKKLLNSPAWQKNAIRKMKAFMSSQPSGYSSFPEYLAPDAFSAGAGRLAATIDQRSRPRKEPQLLASLLDCHQRNVLYEDVPVHLVRAIGRSDVSREIEIRMPSTRKSESKSGD